MAHFPRLLVLLNHNLQEQDLPLLLHLQISLIRPWAICRFKPTSRRNLERHCESFFMGFTGRESLVFCYLNEFFLFFFAIEIIFYFCIPSDGDLTANANVMHEHHVGHRVLTCLFFTLITVHHRLLLLLQPSQEPRKVQQCSLRALRRQVLQEGRLK